MRLLKSNFHIDSGAYYLRQGDEGNVVDVSMLPEKLGGNRQLWVTWDRLDLRQRYLNTKINSKYWKKRKGRRKALVEFRELTLEQEKRRAERIAKANYHREWRLKNKERLAAQKREYYQSNKEKLNAYGRACRERYKEKQQA